MPWTPGASSVSSSMTTLEFIVKEYQSSLNLPSNVSGWNNVGVIDGAFSLLDVGSVVIVGREKIESGFHGFQFELSERSRAVHIDLVLVGQDGLASFELVWDFKDGFLLGS